MERTVRNVAPLRYNYCSSMADWLLTRRWVDRKNAKLEFHGVSCAKMEVKSIMSLSPRTFPSRLATPRSGFAEPITLQFGHQSQANQCIFTAGVVVKIIAVGSRRHQRTWKRCTPPYPRPQLDAVCLTSPSLCNRRLRIHCIARLAIASGIHEQRLAKLREADDKARHASTNSERREWRATARSFRRRWKYPKPLSPLRRSQFASAGNTKVAMQRKHG